MNMFYTLALLKAYVVEVVYEKTFESEVTERIHLAFKEHAIQDPKRYAHTEINASFKPVFAFKYLPNTRQNN